MNIIIVSNRLAKTRTRSITLDGKHLLILTPLLLGLLLVAAFSLQYVLIRFAPESLTDDMRALLSEVRIAEQEKQESYMHSSLDAMAARVGQKVRGQDKGREKSVEYAGPRATDEALAPVSRAVAAGPSGPLRPRDFGGPWWWVASG